MSRGRVLSLVTVTRTSPNTVTMGNTVVANCGVYNILNTTITILTAVLPPFVVVTTISTTCGTFGSGHIITTVLRKVRTNITTMVTDISCSVTISMFGRGDPSSVVVVTNTFTTSYFFGIGTICVILTYVTVNVYGTL